MVSATGLAQVGGVAAGIDAAERSDGAVAGQVAGAETEIVVTGTLVRGIAPVGADVTRVSRESVEASGASTTAQLLQAIPQLTSFNILQFPAGGFNFVDGQPSEPAQPARGMSPRALDNAGAARWAPMVGMGIQSTSPDLDIVPPGMIERVESCPMAVRRSMARTRSAG